MIAPIDGWQCSALGGTIVLTRPGGDIRYTERGGPPLPIDELVDAAMPARAGFTAKRVAEPRKLYTRGGEEAVIVTVSGHVGHVPARRELVFVLADDFVTVTDGLARAWFDELSRTVHHLVKHDVLRLGRRARLATYEGPSGWRRVDGACGAQWLNPSFPEDPASITVWPAARAAANDGPPIADAPASAVPRVVRTSNELVGAIWRWDVATPTGDDIDRSLAVLRYGPYRYAARLDARAGDDHHRGTFAAVIESLHPIPAA